MRNTRYMYAEYSTGEKELYDLVTDPWELTNSVRQPAMATVRSQLHSRLLQLCNPPPPDWQLSP
jgi:hypothetical protein